MITAGVDIGSLTAKAVIFKDNSILASEIIRVKPVAIESANIVMDKALLKAGMKRDDIQNCCSTGYGRLEIPFAQVNMSEISCHGLGAFRVDNKIRTIIDIGGQDCKVISIDKNGMVKDFIMNDKCAAGTGRSLEMLAKTIGVSLEGIGPLSLKSRKPLSITNKCSIFMELEVLDYLYKKKKLKHIACGLSNAVAHRVSSLAQSIEIIDDVCITGGVSKNQGVIKRLEYHMGVRFKNLPVDPQIIGALGAAIFAAKAYSASLDSKEGISSS